MIFQALELSAKLLEPGITTIELADCLEKFLYSRGADPGLIINISVENTVWHGIPGPEKINSGELVTIDIACSLGGWWADSARTFAAGRIDEKRRKLLNASWQLTREIASTIKAGQNGLEASETVRKLTESMGLSLIKEGAGHGIGRRIHEIPSLTYDGRVHERLKAGSIYTVEPVLSSGNGEICISRDGSASTVDGEPSAHFEVMVLLTDNSAQVLGAPEWLHHPPC